MGEHVHYIIGKEFSSMNTIKFTSFILLFLAMHSLYAQDSLSVKWLGSCLGRMARKVACSEIGGITYVFSYLHGSIMVLDVNDPTNPQKVIEIGHPGEPGRGWIGGLAVVDTLLYIAIGPYGVWIYNVANPYAPIRVGTIDTGDACGVAVSGNYAYVADLDSGLVIVDISQPSNPTKMGSLDLHEWRGVRDVAISDTIAYVAARKLAIVNVANPSSPTLVSIWSPHSDDDILQVAVQGNFVYLANFFLSFWIVDVTNPQSPVTADYVSAGLAFDIAVGNGYAYGATEDFVIINIADPFNAYIEGTLVTPGSAQGVCVSENYAYVADFNSTGIIDVSNPAAPQEVGIYGHHKGFAQDVAVSGDYAYVAFGEGGGLRIVDISDSCFPYEVGHWDNHHIARSVAVSGHYAYVADGDSGLRIIDITNPSSPYEVGCFDTIGFFSAVVVAGDYAYVACGSSGFRVVDISNPYSPVCISWLQNAPGTRIVKQAEFVYLNSSIVDVTDPHAPYKVGSFSAAADISVLGDFLYTTTPFSVYDISDHSSPTLLCTLGIYGNGIALGDHYAYIGAGYDNPILSGYYIAGLHEGILPSYRLDVRGYNIYLASDERGLHIFRFFGAPGIEEEEISNALNAGKTDLELYPNPFSKVTRIMFNIDKGAGRIALKIYDVAGQTVKTFLTHSSYLQMPASVIWDRSDDYGRKVSSGVYFCRLVVGEASLTRKILVIR